MAGPQQFSLGYLFLEVFWIAAALGCATQAYRLPSTPDVYIAGKVLLVTAGAICAGAAFGGMGRNMFAGAFIVAVVVAGAALTAGVTLLAALSQ